MEERKRVLMVSSTDINSEESLGVVKKLNGQYKAFQNLGCDTWRMCLYDGEGISQHGVDDTVVAKRKWKTYFTVAALYEQVPKVCAQQQIDICYIRYPLADWAFMRMIKRLHKLCKVVVEIPTYPYDDQVKNNHNPVTQISFEQDRLFRTKMKHYVDCICTFSNDKEIWGTPCVNLCNGVDVKQIRYLGDSLTYDKDVHLIGVARVQKDHGYDRIILGMKSYYESNMQRERKVFFHIVGKGEAEDELRALVKECSLDKYVLFHGAKTGEDLEKLYEGSQIGVGILGAYRSGMDKTSALKHREYCAIGIPFIGSAVDDGFPDDCAYYCKFTNDSSPINIEAVLAFSDWIKTTPEIHREMRTYAEEHFTWESQLGKVIEAIQQAHNTKE